MKKKPRVTLGRLFVVSNDHKHRSANRSYIFTYLSHAFYANGRPVPHLFTDSQLKEARDRAIRNIEDCLPLSRWWRFWK